MASALYWKNSPKSDWDSGYDLSMKPVHEVVSRLKNEGVNWAFIRAITPLMIRTGSAMGGAHSK